MSASIEDYPHHYIPGHRAKHQKKHLFQSLSWYFPEHQNPILRSPFICHVSFSTRIRQRFLRPWRYLGTSRDRTIAVEEHSDSIKYRSKTIRTLWIGGHWKDGNSPRVCSTFARRHKSSFDAVFWVVADEIAKLDHYYQQISLALWLEDPSERKSQVFSREIVKGWLSNPQKHIPGSDDSVEPGKAGAEAWLWKTSTILLLFGPVNESSSSSCSFPSRSSCFYTLEQIPDVL